MVWVILNKLPEDHPLRNKPLIELKAEYQSKDSALWYEVRPAFKIANRSFNQLASAWVQYDIWRVNVEDEWDEDRIDRIGQNGNTGEHY